MQSGDINITNNIFLIDSNLDWGNKFLFSRLENNEESKFDFEWSLNMLQFKKIARG